MNNIKLVGLFGELMSWYRMENSEERFKRQKRSNGDCFKIKMGNTKTVGKDSFIYFVIP